MTKYGSNNMFSALQDDLEDVSVVKNTLTMTKPKPAPQKTSFQKGRRYVKIGNHSNTDRSGFRHTRGTKQRKSYAVPSAVTIQRERMKKYKYEVRKEGHGNILNNSTLYVRTGIATHDQMAAIMDEAIRLVKDLAKKGKTPGLEKDFDSDYTINLVLKEGSLVGYGYIDVSNPALYYILIGYNPDGTERSKEIPDPDWKPPSKEDLAKAVEKLKEERQKRGKTEKTGNEWGDILDDEDEEDESDESLLKQVTPKHPTMRVEMKPLIEIGSFDYTDEQLEFVEDDETYDTVSFSPAFIVPGVGEGYDDHTLFVDGIPNAPDSDMREKLFNVYARFARSDVFTKHDGDYYPKIRFGTKRNRNDDTSKYALVKYASGVDTAFALHMLRKIYAQYSGEDIVITSRHARS